LALTVSIKDLLESGVHFGHQTKRWNPKMSPYIFEAKNNIHIIDLQMTMVKLAEAHEFLKSVGNMEQPVLFVGTKKQAKEAVIAAATKCGMYYINERWLGGFLTNNQTVRKSIERYKNYEQMEQDGTLDLLPKKEAASIKHELFKLRKNLEGIKEMKVLPKAVIIIDPKKEKIAVAEAKKLGIPIVAIVDTNSDPEEIDYCVPGNDDAMKSVRILTSVFADAILEGKASAHYTKKDDGKSVEEKTDKKEGAVAESAGEKQDGKESKEPKKKTKKVEKEEKE